MDNYSTMKLELLALKWAVTEKFRDYLLGSKCTCYTDNNPLTYIKTAKLGAAELNWVSQLAQFDLEIKYKPGRANINADSLSRMPQPEPEKSFEVISQHITASTSVPTVPIPVVKVSSIEQGIDVSNPFPQYTEEQLAKMQREDEVLGKLWRFWEQGKKPSNKKLRKQAKKVRSLL